MTNLHGGFMSMASQFASLVWIKNDLRIRDNPALSFASHEKAPTIALYVLDEKLYYKNYGGARSFASLTSHLKSFEETLKEYGIPFLVKTGNTCDEIKSCLHSFKIKSIFWNEGLEPDVLVLEKEIQKELTHLNIEIHRFPKNLLFDPESIGTRQGTSFKIFTPFWKNCQVSLQEIQEAPLPKKQSLYIKKSTSEEKKAWERLLSFSQKNLLFYPTHRDLLGIDGTSCLSTHLHFGELSVRSLYINTKEQSEFTRQLLWREFAHYILHHFPKTIHEPFRKDFIHFPWRYDKNELQAWESGQTGIPLVDAAMRQLIQTGWMHNRARLIVASFLTKHLLHKWTEGLDFFWNTLYDADLANNTFGWQWVAGCGLDASPFFRIFNPLLQAKRFDSENIYVKTYVPELKELPEKWIQRPWEASPALLHSCGITLGKTYPYPIISLEEGRKRALQAYHSVKK